MEFHEKLQELRKARGLTQEELAQALYVSRTAISKWESGKGYPNIDSLKMISGFFSVSIDDLLSSTELMTAAEQESELNLRRLCDQLLGIVDLMGVMLVLLPLYPQAMGDYIASVNLFACAQASLPVRCGYWLLPIALVGLGAAKLLLVRLNAEKGHKPVTALSLVLGAIAVLFMTMTRAPYAAAVAFLLFLLKAALVYRRAVK